jgi:hypothetical protein
MRLTIDAWRRAGWFVMYSSAVYHEYERVKGESAIMGRTCASIWSPASDGRPSDRPKL